MFKIMFSVAVCIAVMLFGAKNSFYTQESAIPNKDKNLATMQLENVQIEAQSIGQFFSELSLSYDIPIGVEVELNDDEFANYHIDFKKGTLSELLTQFVTKHNQYAWEVKDGVVNVFPKDKYRDVILDELLEAEISSFSVKEKTTCWVLEESLVTTPEVKKILEANGINHKGLNFSGAYIPQLGRHFTLDVSNMTLKAILNKVIKESPVAKSWLIKRYSSDQTFFIRLNARHEDSPLRTERFGLPQ